MRRRDFLSGLAFVALTFRTGVAFANKSSTSIEAPSAVPRGSEALVRVTVTHSSNSSSHHTEWLRVIVKQKEIARWDFKGNNLPEAAVFTREIKVKVLENLELTAEANCNRHGSNGPTTVKINLRD